MFKCFSEFWVKKKKKKKEEEGKKRETEKANKAKAQLKTRHPATG